MEFITQLPGFIFGLFSGIILTFWGHWLARRRHREEIKKDVKVFCDLMSKKRTWYISGIPEAVVEYITISAVNEGSRPITITNAGFELENGENYWPSADKMSELEEWNLPRRIDVGELAGWIIELEWLLIIQRKKQSIIKRVWVCDATNNMYSRQIPMEIKETIQETLDKQ